MGLPPVITMSRGRTIDLSGPQYYQDLLTGIAVEILGELAELIEQSYGGFVPPPGFE